MLQSEKQGLDMLSNASCIGIPDVIFLGAHAASSYLVLDYIEEGQRDHDFWSRFGRELADLHRQTCSHFGADTDNFIGLLPQSNQKSKDWVPFYTEQRILPQITLAVSSGKLNNQHARQAESLCNVLSEICPSEPPALIHGDLWAGNFLCNAQGKPYLVDPSVSYAHREMDLAMSQLFGGFDPMFYQSYQESFSLQPGFDNRSDIYQLYYLLVHLNLFGSAYYGQVTRILQRYG